MACPAFPNTSLQVVASLWLHLSPSTRAIAVSSSVAGTAIGISVQSYPQLQVWFRVIGYSTWVQKVILRGQHHAIEPRTKA